MVLWKLWPFGIIIIIIVIIIIIIIIIIIYLFICSMEWYVAGWQSTLNQW